MKYNRRLLSALFIGISFGIAFSIVFDNIAIGGGLGLIFGVSMYEAEKPKPLKISEVPLMPKFDKGVGEDGGLRYSFHSPFTDQYFLSVIGLVHALWLDGKGRLRTK